MSRSKVFLNRWTVATLVSPMLIACVFFLFFLPAAKHASNHPKQLEIAVVNSAGQVGSTIVSQLHTHLPFTLVTAGTESAAKQDLNDDKVTMVFEIPKDFPTAVRQGDASLDFVMNGASSSSLSSIMQLTQVEVTDAVNQAVISMVKGGILQGDAAHVGQLPLPATAKKTIASSIAQAVSSVPSHPVQAHVTTINEAKSSLVTLLPFLTIITFFLGSMGATAMSYLAVQPLRSQNDNRYLPGATQMLLNIITACLVAGLDVLLFHAFGIDPVANAFLTWATLGFGFLTSCLLIQIFVYLVGLGGMGMGLLLFPLQLITSGAILPSALLPKGYVSFATVLPAPHLTDAVSHLYLGGGQFAHDIRGLALISLVGIVVIFGRLSIRRRRASQA